MKGLFVNNVIRDNIEGIATKQRMNIQQSVEGRANTYNAEFWKHYNAPLETANESKIFKELQNSSDPKKGSDLSISEKISTFGPTDQNSYLWFMAIKINKRESENSKAKKLAKARAKSKKIDWNKYFGKINFRVDALDYQRKLRNEWSK